MSPYPYHQSHRQPVLATATQRLVHSCCFCIGVISCDSAPNAETPDTLPVPIVAPPFPSTQATSIAFSGASARLNLTAGVPTEVDVQVLPPGEYAVRFSITGGDEPFNVFLSHAQAETDKNGLASVTIHARGTNLDKPRLVAAVGALSTAPLFLYVGASTDATLSVRALEPTGSTRLVTEWVLSAHLDAQCSDLEGTLPPHGQYRKVASYSGPEQEIILPQVPSGQPLAIVLRAGEFAGACKNLSPLNPSSQNFTDLEVNLRPMHLDESQLDLDFGLDAATQFNTLYGDFSFQVADAISSDDTDDLDAVLDAMAELSGDVVAFETAREANTWRTTWLIEQGTALAGAGTRDLVRSWMQAGLAELTTPSAFQGFFAIPDEAGATSFSLNSVAQSASQNSGFTVPALATVVAEANDFLRMNLTLQWQPEIYLFAAAQRQAQLEVPSAATVAAALSSAFNCTALGETLTRASPAPSVEAFLNCDPQCVQTLCEQAMESLWSEMANVILPRIEWEVTASAQATVDTAARPESATGGSLHSLTVADTELNVTGTFQMVALPPLEQDASSTD